MIRSRFVLCLLFLAALSLCWTASCPAAGPGQDFNAAYDAFHALTKDKKKSMYRSEWVKVERKFQALYERDSDGDYGPKALYYLGRIQEELGYRSGLRSDFSKAVDYYQRMAGEYPSHAWTDDVLYRSAELRAERLGQLSKAYQDLQTSVRHFPNGDMYGQAKAWLEQMDEASADTAGGGGVVPAGGTAHLDMIRYRSSDEYTRVVLEMDQPVEFVYKFLDPLPEQDKPCRVYVDLRSTLVGQGILKNVKISDGILSGYRVGQNSPDTTRVVLDLLEHQEHKVFYLDNPFRIIIDVYAPEASAPAQASAPSSPQSPSGPDTAEISLDPTGDLIEQLGLTVKTIMLDPGHGGRDNGAVHNGLKEKDLNLKVALLLGKLLEKQGFNILYTRKTDEFVSLEDRTAMANLQKVDMFISLHFNAHRSSKIRGFEVYSLNMAKTEDAKRVAAKENAVDPKQISDLQYILSDLMLSSKIEESSDLAEVLQSCVIKQVRKDYKIVDHGHREAPFYVLMGAKMPAVLVEMGYMSNASEAKLMKKEAYLKALAQGIAQGVAAYKKQIERFAMR